MVQIMCRFPVVIHFVAILYGRIECGETIPKKENVEGNDGRKEELARGLPLVTIEGFSIFLIHACVVLNLTVSPYSEDLECRCDLPEQSFDVAQNNGSNFFSLVGNIVLVIAPNPSPTLAGIADQCRYHKTSGLTFSGFGSNWNLNLLIYGRPKCLRMIQRTW